MVSVEYLAVSGRGAGLLAATRYARFSRCRTGASSWRAGRMAATRHGLSQFVIASWPEHLRQHKRIAARDQQRYAAIRAMTDLANPAGSRTG